MDPLAQEQDDKMNMQNVLENLKEQFLRTFNISGLGPPPLPPGSTREEPPEYMMELYNRFANDRSAMPTANIIRSFKNEGKDSPFLFDECSCGIHQYNVPHYDFFVICL